MGTVDRLIEGALRRRALVLVGVVFLVALGVWSVLRIPIDAFPDVTNIQVEVLSTAPGMSPPEVERFVTYPVETSMRGLPRLAELRSVSKAGLSVVTVIFEDGSDIYFARQLVLERLIEARERVPEGVEIAMGPVSTAMGEIYQFTLDGARPESFEDETDYLTEVRTVQDWVLAPLLKSIPGVYEVNSFGGYIRQYQVTVDPDKLLAYDLGLGRAPARARVRAGAVRLRPRRRRAQRTLRLERRRRLLGAASTQGAGGRTRARLSRQHGGRRSAREFPSARADLRRLPAAAPRLEPDEHSDVVTLAQAERAILEFRLPERGRYMFHPHQAAMAERGAMGWFSAV